MLIDNMKTMTSVKKALYAISVCMFFYQTAKAFIKYFESPTVIQTREGLLSDNNYIKPR